MTFIRRENGSDLDNLLIAVGVFVTVEGDEASAPFDLVIIERDIDQAARLEAETLQLRTLTFLTIHTEVS